MSASNDFAAELRQWLAIAEAQLRHYVKTYRFYGLLAFVIGVSAATLYFQSSTPTAIERQIDFGRASEYLSNYLVNTNIWVILAAAFFGGDALSTDFSSGTGYYLLVQPVRRRTVLAGRYASAFGATTVAVLVYFGFGALGCSYFFGATAVPWVRFDHALGLSLLFALACISVAFCISAFVRSPSSGVLMTVLALYVGFSAIEGSAEAAGYEPWWDLNYAGGAIVSATDTDFVHFIAIPLGTGQYTNLWYPYTFEGTVIMIAYLLLFLPLSLFLYERKESSG